MKFTVNRNEAFKYNISQVRSEGRTEERKNAAESEES